MTIRIKVSSPEEDVEESKVDTEKQPQARVELDARRTLGGDLAIYDHEDLDIVISPKTRKIVAYPKDELGDIIYDAESRMFDYLTKKGVISRESVRSGNVYGSMEGSLEESPYEGIDAIEVAILAVTKFLETETPRFMYQKQVEDREEERLTNPDSDDSTELGEVPQSPEKGSIRPGIYRSAYAHNRAYRS